jgi:hypothetical protein
MTRATPTEPNLNDAGQSIFRTRRPNPNLLRRSNPFPVAPTEPVSELPKKPISPRADRTHFQWRRPNPFPKLPKKLISPRTDRSNCALRGANPFPVAPSEPNPVAPSEPISGRAERTHFRSRRANPIRSRRANPFPVAPTVSNRPRRRGSPFVWTPDVATTLPSRSNSRGDLHAGLPESIGDDQRNPRPDATTITRLRGPKMTRSGKPERFLETRHFLRNQ